MPYFFVRLFAVVQSRPFAQRMMTSDSMNATAVSTHVIPHIIAQMSPKMAPMLVRASAKTCRKAEWLLMSPS